MAQYTPAFSRIIELSHTPEWRGKVWKTGGNCYDRRGDFRAISGGELPVILHQGNRFNKKAGDKVELIETGNLKVLDMVATVQSLYQIDALDQRILRLDLASDNEGVAVEWFRTNTYARFKQVQEEWNTRTISKNRAETLYFGRAPNQLRIYDKTRHRKVLLSKERRSMPKSDRDLCMTFEERWGYPADKVITRVERQIGGEQIAKVGYTRVGNLYELGNCHPFTQIVFPDDVRRPQRLKGLTAEQQITAEYLRDFAMRDGIQHMWNELYNRCPHRTQFYRLKKRYEPFVMPLSEADGTTREKLHKAFLASMQQQLKYAA